MRLTLQYQTYNSSWLKFLGALSFSKFFFDIATYLTVEGHRISIVDLNAPFIERFPAILGSTIIFGYHAHNLYAQYQHNKSLEFTFHTHNGTEVIAKPNYFDIYSAYNIDGCIFGLLDALSVIYASDKVSVARNAIIPIYFISKLMHLSSSDYNDYHFINKETGESTPETFLELLNTDNPSLLSCTS